MESAAVLRSFNCSVGNVSHGQSILKRPCIGIVHNVSWPTLSKTHVQGSGFGGKLVSSPIKWEEMVVTCAKTSETSVAAKYDDDDEPQGLQEKRMPSATFPSGFEELILEVCDETEVAELKLKVGDFEMHLKRNIATEAPLPVFSHTARPPTSSSPVVESAPASLPKSSTEKVSPFMNVSAAKSAKIAALEASGSSTYVLVPSTIVGSFRKGRTLKGTKQPPICKEGDVITEGQVIGYVEQFGTEFPVRTDVAGEVLKVLYDEGEAVGYGDPLIAVLPSFHSIQ